MDLEQALRRDLADAVRAQMSDQLLNGDPTVANQSGDVTGFYKRLAAPADPAAVADYAAYAGVHALAVDGIHAFMETEVSSVVPVGVYQHVAAVYQAGSGESGSEAMKRRSAGCVASSFATAPANASGVSKGTILHAGKDAMCGDSVAAMWPTLEVIRDIYSGAGEGRNNPYLHSALGPTSRCARGRTSGSRSTRRRRPSA